MLGERGDPRILLTWFAGRVQYVFAPPPPEAGDTEEEAEPRKIRGACLGYMRRRVADPQWEVIARPGTKDRNVFGPFDEVQALAVLDKETVLNGGT